MRTVEVVFAVVWAAFWLYWLVAAFSMKRGRVPWSRELGIRAVIVVLVILLVRFGVFQHHASNTDLWLAGVGLVLFALGLGFAIWARMHIGRNWGTPMTQKDEPELVTSGPYHLVRHPICGLPGCPGTRFLVSSGLFEGGSETVVQLLDGHGGEVVDRLVGALSVVPVHPFQGGGFDLVQVSPWPFRLDELGLVQADRGLGQGIVVSITD
jgi:protein-S-isoprenylcysteine O-methyltransferase Ste14